MSNSYTPPDRSTYDPGWNDPPPMPTMGQTTSGIAKPRLNLNKRVAFPMQSSGAPSSSNVKTTAEGLPLPFSTAKYQPPPMNTPPTLPPANTQPVMPPPSLPPPCDQSTLIESTPVQTSDETFDAEAAEQFCNATFTRLIDAMTTNTDQAKMTEIQKRIDILNQMWKESKLDELVQKILYDLAKALENGDATAAMEQHRLLATKHNSISIQWATALRQIILSISPESEQNAQDAPAVLTDTDVVQFVDVSTKPIVMDSIPSIPSNPIQPPPELIPSNIEQSSETSVNPIENAVSTNQKESKSKFGRFGRILHI